MANVRARAGLGVAVAAMILMNGAVVAARSGGQAPDPADGGAARSASLAIGQLTDSPPTLPSIPTSPTETSPTSTPPPQTTPVSKPPAGTSPARVSTTTTSVAASRTTTTRPRDLSLEDPGVPFDPEPDEGLYLINADGTAPRMLAAGYVTPWDWSPDGTRLTAMVGRKAAIVRADGSGASFLAAVGDSNPRLSPDGRLVAFHRYPDGLFVSPADGSGAARLVTSWTGSYDWTPDNQLVVMRPAGPRPPAPSPMFPNPVEREPSAWVVFDLKGGQRVVAAAAAQNTGQSVSPDGRWIAFYSEGLVLAAMDGSVSRTLTGPCCTPATVSIAWSPDSLRMAYEDNGGTVRVVAVDGTGDRLLASSASAPAWSPDGQSIAFLDWTSGRAALGLINANGNGRRIVYSAGPDRNVGAPLWSPNGRQLAIPRFWPRAKGLF